MKSFTASNLREIYQPHRDSNGEDNGQVTIIGGSHLFHGAPLFGVKVASRIVDMVFFSSPEPSLEKSAEGLKLRQDLYSFIWSPWDEVEKYIAKSDAVLIGPGFMRYSSEHAPHGQDMHVCDEVCQKTRKVTKDLLDKFPDKKWVIDAGSLQVISPEWIPSNAIVTPNKKEYEWLFDGMDPKEAAKKYNCIIVRKGPITTVYSPDEQIEVNGGNPGLTKGGTGDTQAGLTVALLAKNDPVLAACAASFLTKAAAEHLSKKVGLMYNADDLANAIPQVYNELINL